jgi:hypothetical protein
MKTQNLLIVSTAHLHPLEAKVINKYAYVSNQECALVSTESDMREFYAQADLVCLVEFLQQVKDKFNANYVVFDPDADCLEDFKTYDW